MKEGDPCPKCEKGKLHKAKTSIESGQNMKKVKGFVCENCGFLSLMMPSEIPKKSNLGKERDSKSLRNIAIILFAIGMFRWFFGGPDSAIYLVGALILVTIYEQKKEK